MELTPKAHAYIDYVVGEVVGKSGIQGAILSDDGENPFAYFIDIPIKTDERLVVKTCNELFHALELLPPGKDLALGEMDDYCHVVRVGSSDDECYLVHFNHPSVPDFKDRESECEFILKNWDSDDDDDAAAAEMLELVEGIKAGRLKSKSSDGYLVLKAEFYDAIEAGEKKVEYRDFTEYNLKRTIGIKTVRFNRGYVKNAPQMRWEVKKIVLLDCEDNECDPFNVPEDFWPVTIALRLGKRIA